ncbi:MAG: nitric oxide-sensing protein NosP [Alsobacter sp.]
MVAVASADAADARQLADKLHRQMPPDGLAALVVFFSADYDASDLAARLAELYPTVPTYGCTTAGELTPRGLDDHSAVAIGFPSCDFTVVAQAITDLSTFGVEDGRSVVTHLRARLAQTAPGATSDTTFGLLLVDGMSRREETVISALYSALDDIPIVGGSAGDGLRFGRTWMIHDGKATENGAVMLLVHTSLPFHVFKSDHFEATDIKMVVTEADIAARTVKELNAEPAATEYARAVGIIDHSLDALSFASHPVVVRVGGEYYARSIQRVNEDGSLSFFCAIDEGLVLTAARRRDMLQSIRELFQSVEEEIGAVDVYLGFDCVLRRLDAEQRQVTHELSELYRRNRVIGFNTYGEQFRSMHLNQTFTGVAIGRRRGA